jgi:signal transduction histidine kinase
MIEETGSWRHLGGGRKGLFLILRYVFIIAASYLLLFHRPDVMVPPIGAAMIAAALASNIFLSFLSPRSLFAWYVEAPVLIGDTLWVSWALHSTGAIGQEFFLLYFFVLFLAASGESLLMVVLGTTAVTVANVYLVAEQSVLAPTYLLRIVFFFSVAMFYGYVLSQIRKERQRADRGFAWARELEAKVEQRTEALRRLYDESLVANRLKSEFVANMSHELRTPLHIIMGYAEMLLGLDQPPVDDGRLMLRRIQDAAGNLLQLVNSVLDLGKLDAGRVPVMSQTVSLTQFATQLQRRDRVPRSPAVRIEWDVAPDLPSIETDSTKLTSILDNLINNAIKFTAAGSITVRARNVPAEREVEFQVEDTGRGIDETELSRIFEPFYQVNGAVAHPCGGVGLGLAIVQRYLTLLGGSIAVRSRVGEGATFTVRLPYRNERSSEASAASRATEPESRRAQVAA